jgi:hypothetical protein
MANLNVGLKFITTLIWHTLREIPLALSTIASKPTLHSWQRTLFALLNCFIFCEPVTCWNRRGVSGDWREEQSRIISYCIFKPGCLELEGSWLGFCFPSSQIAGLGCVVGVLQRR